MNLPDGYRLLREIDLQKDKKLAVGVNLGALSIALLLGALGLAVHPFSLTAGSSTAGGLFFDFLPSLLLLGSMILYLFLHELTHGFFIRRYAHCRVEYGFTGLNAFAGNRNAYFDRRSYLVIGLSPVVLLGSVLLLGNLIFPAELFWFFYLLQIVNLSGAAGDLYVTWLVLRMPEDVLINDSGVSMRFYAGPGELPAKSAL